MTQIDTTANGQPEKPRSPALSWWASLQGGEDAPPDRAALALLRRCDTPAGAFFVPAFHRLWRMYGRREDAFFQRRLAVAAIVLAHVRANDGARVARRMGPSVPGAEDAKVSEARFRRILRAQGDEELLRAMVRLVKMLEGTATVADLANSILYWNDRTRQRWAFDYYNAADAAPQSVTAEAPAA